MLTHFPETIRAGDTLQITLGLDDYSAEDWDCTIVLANSTNVYTLTSSADNASFYFTISATSTGNYVAGDYNYVVRVSNIDNEEFTADSGIVTIKSKYSVAADQRSFNKKMLDYLEALLLRMSVNPDQQYSLAGRSITKKNLKEVQSMRDDYKARVNNQIIKKRVKNGGYDPNIKFVSFKKY